MFHKLKKNFQQKNYHIAFFDDRMRRSKKFCAFSWVSLFFYLFPQKSFFGWTTAFKKKKKKVKVKHAMK